MQGVLLQASPYRGKPPWLFLFCFSVSRHHSRRVRGPMPSAPQTRTPTSWMRLPVLMHAEKTVANRGSRDLKEVGHPLNQFTQTAQMLFLQHHCGQQQCTQWKRSPLKKIKTKIN